MPRQHLIKIRSGTTTPLAADFQVGEPAWNSTAKILYIKAGDSTMAAIGLTSKTVKIDSTSVANVIYVGKADSGTADNANSWRITRTVCDAAGAQTSSSSLTSVAWSNRTSLTYP